MTNNEILSKCSGMFTDDFEEVSGSNVTCKILLKFFLCFILFFVSLKKTGIHSMPG